MTALDEVQVKEGVDQETVDAVKSVGEKYKYGFETEIETEYALRPRLRRNMRQRG